MRAFLCKAIAAVIGLFLSGCGDCALWDGGPYYRGGYYMDGSLLDALGTPVPLGTISFAPIQAKVPQSFFTAGTAGLVYTLEVYDNLDCSQARTANPGSATKILGSATDTCMGAEFACFIWNISAGTDLNGRIVILRSNYPEQEPAAGLFCSTLHYLPRVLAGCAHG